MKKEKKKPTRKRYSKTAGRHIKKIYSVFQQLEQPTHYDNETGKITHFNYEKGKLRMRKGAGIEKAHQDVRKLMKVKYVGGNRKNIRKATLSKEGRYMMVIGSPAARGWDELTRAQQKRTVEHTQQVFFDYLKSKNKRMNAEQIRNRIPEQLRMARQMVINTIEDGKRTMTVQQVDGLQRRLDILAHIEEAATISQIVSQAHERAEIKARAEREQLKTVRMSKILRWDNGVGRRKTIVKSPNSHSHERSDILGRIPHEWPSEANARIIREINASRATDNHSPTWAYHAGASIARGWRSLRKRWRR